MGHGFEQIHFKDLGYMPNYDYDKEINMTLKVGSIQHEKEGALFDMMCLFIKLTNPKYDLVTAGIHDNEFHSGLRKRSTND